MSQLPIHGQRRARVLVFVCVLGVIAGALAGSIIPIRMSPVSGLALGGLGGLAAGILWYRIMIGKLARRGRRLWFVGMVWGVVAGLKATAILHGGALLLELVHASSGPHRELGLLAIYNVVLPIGLILGVGAGAVVGLVCTWVCRILVRPPQPGHLGADT